MFKEMKGLEYTLEILRAFKNNLGQHDSQDIHRLVAQGGRVANASLSYVQKILPRMVKVGLLSSSEVGYALVGTVENVPIGSVLEICDMPAQTSPLYKMCQRLKASEGSINDFYDFAETPVAVESPVEPATESPV